VDQFEVMPQPLLYRPEEAAQLLGVGRTMVYELIRAGRLRSIKLGGARRITPAALADLVASLEGEQAA
jgi:excisionase family DNA binding protein